MVSKVQLSLCFYFLGFPKVSYEDDNIFRFAQKVKVSVITSLESSLSILIIY